MNRRVMALVVLFLVGGMIASVQAQPLAQYTFDDGTAADVSGNGHDGVLLANDTAAAEIVEDPERGSVLKINARGMKVEGPFDITTAFTLAAWIKIDVPRSGRAFSGGPWTLRTDNQGSTDHLWMEVRYPAGAFLDKFNTSTAANPEGQLDGQWHHYTFVLADTGEFVVYFDGVKAASRDGKAKAHDFGGISAIFFGVETATFTNGLQGSMDDIALFNYAITEAELADLLTPGPQPIARFTFDDGTAADNSGNGHDGVLLSNDTAAAEVVNDPERGSVLGINARGMQVDGPFDITTEFTLAAWIKIDVPRSGRAFSGGPWTLRTDNQGSAEHLWLEVRYPGGTFLDKFDTRTTTNPQGQLDGQWHHYAWVLNDTGKFSVYFDGVAAPSRDNKEKAHDFNGVGTVFFGTENAKFTNALQGCMDDISLYNVALTAEQILLMTGYQGALDPAPANGAVDVDGGALALSWKGPLDRADMSKLLYVVYLDPSKAAVEQAPSDPNQLLLVVQDVLVTAETPNDKGAFVLETPLDAETTYYWRVDTEVVMDNPEDPGAPILLTIPGVVWNFTTASTEAEVVPLPVEPVVDDGDLD